MLTSHLLIPCCNYQAMHNWFDHSNRFPFTKYFEGGSDTLIHENAVINTEKVHTHTRYRHLLSYILYLCFTTSVLTTLKFAVIISVLS